MLEFAPDAMVIINDKGRIEVVNIQTEKLFGYSRDEMIGQPIELSDTPARIETAPPLLGQHTDEVLRGVGYTEDEISAFHEDGAV